jgi:hypothetical protein
MNIWRHNIMRRFLIFQNFGFSHFWSLTKYVIDIFWLIVRLTFLNISNTRAFNNFTDFQILCITFLLSYHNFTVACVIISWASHSWNITNTGVNDVFWIKEWLTNWDIIIGVLILWRIIRTNMCSITIFLTLLCFIMNHFWKLTKFPLFWSHI